MFLRWKRRVLRRTDETVLQAFLVRNFWQHGQTRQQTVCYLGSIRERTRMVPAHRQAFWARVEVSLATVPLETATRQRVEQRLEEKVPRLTGAEQHHLAQQQVRLAQMAALLTAGTMPAAPGGAAPGTPEHPESLAAK